ncbi:hypothetical protein N7E81_09825 [Reichenbachiella carrageenanivorans]|uniref:Conjugal transfer protein TraD n=1 Tax=Reichenbachiella carrageenanivorans TaxID=2979869 RepID=A0ABY6CUR0_9BACT|nr:hypothetical protein [Reichenbachiella carrageenanivorans]UXX77667.1 hypothetical protein N7E81_09825 [Reichenbachiella carrageenanivorans]
MDDSVIYYLVLGAIYLLSKVFKKKKENEPVNMEEYDEEQSSRPAKKAPPTFEDLLKELTGESSSSYTEEERTQPLTPAEPVLATDIIDYQRQNIEAVAPDEMIDIVPHKPLERKKIEFMRNDKFALEEYDDEMAEGIEEMLSDYDGIRQAIVLKEVLDRKY